MGLAATVAGAAVVGALPATGAGALGAASDSSPQQTVNQAVSSLHNAGSGRVVITADHQGVHSSETIDLGSKGGVATVNQAGQTLHILYTGNTVYLRAKPAVLTSVIGMPANLASKYGGKWLSAPTSVSSIGQLAQLFSFKTYSAGLVNLSGPLGHDPTTSSNGQQVVGVTGTVPKTSFNQGSGGDHATLLVAKSSPHHPVSVAFSDASNGSTTFEFGKWGEHVAVVKPSKSTPLSKVASQAQSPSGGGSQTPTTGGS